MDYPSEIYRLLSGIDEKKPSVVIEVKPDRVKLWLSCHMTSNERLCYYKYILNWTCALSASMQALNVGKSTLRNYTFILDF